MANRRVALPRAPAARRRLSTIASHVSTSAQLPAAPAALDTIVAQLLESYGEGGSNSSDGLNLPTEASVQRLATELMSLMFPGFFEATAPAKAELAAATERRLALVSELLHDCALKALRFAQRPDPDAAAETACAALLTRLPAIRAVVQTDIAVAFDGDPSAVSIEEIIVAYPCVLVISLQRLAHELFELNVPLVPRMITEYAHSRTGVDIHPGATIGNHFFIDHCTGVVIGETCVIGDHVTLYHGVTLGATSFELDDEGNPVKGGVKRHPDVEDYVTIYPNAVILGGSTTIGHHSVVGANAWCLKSIPPESIVYYLGVGTTEVRPLASRPSLAGARPMDVFWPEI